MFGSKVRFALNTALALARRESWVGAKGAVTVRDLARETELSAPYLAKVVQEMVAAGIIKARKGPGGGILLARPPEEISLADLIFSLDRVDGMRRCVLEDQPCSDVDSCPVHETFKVIREDILGGGTLADVIAGRSPGKGKA